MVIQQARTKIPEGDTVDNLHILWQTDSHCPTLAVSGEFTKHVLFQMFITTRCCVRGRGKGMEK